MRSFVQQFHFCYGDVKQAHDLLGVRSDGRLRGPTLLVLEVNGNFLILKLFNDEVLTVVPQIGVRENMRGWHRRRELRGSVIALLLPSPWVRAVEVLRVLPYLVSYEKLVELVSRLLQEVVERKVEGLVREVQPLERRVEVFALGVPELAMHASKGRPDTIRLILVLSNLEKI